MTEAALWSSLPLPALILDAEDRIQRVNPEAEAFLNLSARMLVGHPLADRLTPARAILRAAARVRADEAPITLAEIQLGAAGRSAPATLHLAPLAGAAGQVVLIATRPEGAGHILRGAGPQAAAKAAIGMAEMLAHEIKNPLAGITGAAQLLSMTLGPEDRELTELIVAESRRIVKLLEQVEQFGDTRPPELLPLNIHDVLDRARRSAQLGFAAGMRIIEEFDPSLPPTLGDADQLVQVILNLLKNAAEACGGTGTIRLRTYYDHALRRAGPEGPRALPLQVEVIDTGPGIPPDIAAHIFEPFVSGRENGTGLGLALVSKIVAAHGGWIAVDSEPGRTLFRISLPKAPSPKPQNSKAPNEVP